MRVPAFLFVALSFAAPACGAPPHPHKHTEPLSAAEHEQNALAHEREAEREQQQIEPAKGADDTRCIDQNQEPLYSGGERTKVMMPCWTQAERNASYLRDAEANRRAAADHRRWARALTAMEDQACSKLSREEREISPLSRQPDILAVEEYREGGQLLGAKITVRKVKGLGKEWLTASVACHQARAAELGYDEKYMPLSPLALPKTSVSINEEDDSLVVTVRSKDPIVAAQIYGRAARVLDKSE